MNAPIEPGVRIPLSPPLPLFSGCLKCGQWKSALFWLWLGRRNEARCGVGKMRRLAFLARGALREFSLFLRLAGGVGLGLFLRGLLVHGFWRSVAHNNLSSFLSFTRPRNVCFSEGVRELLGAQAGQVKYGRADFETVGTQRLHP